MEKKEKQSMDKLAKMDMLKALRKMAMDMINEGGQDEEEMLQKVTVAAKDKEGLKKGLEKAEDVLEGMPNGESEEMESEDEMDLEESPEEDIAALEAKLAALKAKKLKA